MDLQTRSDVLEYLKRRPRVVMLATAAPDGQPAASPVYYVVTDDGSVIVSSNLQTRKWQNLRENPRVALAFGVSLDQPSIQCDGEATLLERGTEFEAAGEAYFSQVPEARKFSEGTMGLIKIRPGAFRITTYVADSGPVVREVA